MKISNGQACIVGLFVTFIGIGIDKMGYPIPGQAFIAVGIAGIFVVLIYNFRNPKKDKGENIVFPQLRIPALKKYASKWGKTYLGLKRIVLYEAPLTYPNIAGETVKYLLVFKFGKRAKDLYHHRRFEENNLGLPEWLFDKHFPEVYLDNPPANFVDQWSIITYIPEDVDPKYSVVLFKK